MAQFDPSILNGQKTLLDRQRLQEQFDMQKQAANLKRLAQIQQLTAPPDFSQAANQAALNLASGQANDEDKHLLTVYSQMHPRSKIAGLNAPVQTQAVQTPSRLSVQGIPTMPTAALNEPTPVVNAPLMTPADPGVVDLGIQDDAGDFAPNPNARLNGSDQSAPQTGVAFLQTLDPKMASVVKMIGDGKVKDTAVLSRMKPEMKLEILQNVAKYNPDYSGNNFTAQGKFLSGTTGDKVRSLNVAVSHLNDTLSPLIDALGNGDFPLVNRLSNIYAQQTGQPGPTNFNSAKQIVADEIVKAVVNSGGGVGDREEAQKQIDAANSPAQLKGVISTYTSLLKGQLHGFEQQYKSAGGDGFDNKFIAPETQSVLGGVQDVNSEAEAMALPVGTRFRLNGKTGTVK